ncbi:MAG: response regulator transcription factor [Gammaproteobacteria bacterium]
MIKVLIIDDSEIIRERLSEMLSKIENVEIIGKAGFALEGLNLARSHKPRFVILDIRMPDISGLDILGDIKKIDPAPVIVALTNYPYPSYRKRCMKLGADYFFDKSSEFSKVRAVVMDRMADVGAAEVIDL